MKKAKTPNQKSQEGTLVSFLLDRTGSMASVKVETIGGFNGYLDEMLKRKESKALRFSLTQFDSIGIDLVHNAVPLNEVIRLTNETYLPRANTPLYDAIGKTIRATEGAAKPDDKVLFVVLTDGEENSSSEWNETTVRALIKEKEDKAKWTFAYIGVGPDAWAANAHLAKGTIGASNVLRSSQKNYQQSYGRLANATSIRCCAAAGQSLTGVMGQGQLDKDDQTT